MFLLAILPGPDKRIVRVIRFLLTCRRAFFLIRGAGWARLVSGMPFVLGALTSILAFLGIESLGVPHFSLFRIWLVLVTAFYLALASCLFLDRDVSQCFG